MAIVINGNGSISGISVGGLPDGSVDSDTLASGIDKTSISDSGDATAITIDSSERVGIGTGSPTARLHVYNANDHVRLSAQCAQNTGQHWQFQSRNNGEFWLRNETTGSNKLIIDSTGAVTMPSQPAFLAYHNATTSNLTNGDIIPFNSTIFDQNDDLHASSGVFTAPITGRYQFSFLVSVTELDASATYNRILLKCSNRTVPFGITASQMFDGSGSNDPSYYAFEGSLLLDMDANDTCKLEWNQSGGANQADAFDSTYFSGYLVC